jgi:hypothetical protein
MQNVADNQEKGHAAQRDGFNDIDHVAHAGVSPPAVEQAEACYGQQAGANENGRSKQQDPAVRQREFKSQQPCEHERAKNETGLEYANEPNTMISYYLGRPCKYIPGHSSSHPNCRNQRTVK